MSNNYIRFALLFLFLGKVKCKIPIDKIYANENFHEYTKVALYVTKRFLASNAHTLVITEKCDVFCKGKENYQEIILNELLLGLSDTFTIQLHMGFYNDRLWDYNIFLVDSYQAFEILRYTFPTTQHERNFNFLILLTWSTNNQIERDQILIKIFEIVFKYNVRNVVIMYKSLDDRHISFYSYEPFAKDYCQNNITIQEINRYENGSLQTNKFLPDLISDFHGCLLNVSAHEIDPLLSFKGDIDNETHLKESNRLSGVEGDILKEVAKSLNFKFQLHFPKQANYISLIQNSTGCFGDLDSNRAQMVIGGFSSAQPNSLKFSTSSVHHTTPYVFVVRRALAFSPIKQLVKPLGISIWLYLVIFFTIFFVLTKILQTKSNLYDFLFGPKNKKPISSMVVIIFGYSLPHHILPTRNFARFLFIASLFLTFEIRSGYQGKLFDSLRYSKRIQIPQKISELIEQNYTLLSSDSSISIYPYDKTINIPHLTTRLNMLQNSSLQLTATALLDSLTHYNYINSNTSSLTYVQEIIYLFQCVMFFQKQSIFRSSIDRKLKIFSAAGITSRIAKQNIHLEFQNINNDSQFVGSLTNEHLKGLYFITGVMLLISLFVFIFELISVKSRKMRKTLDILNSI